MPGTFYPRLSEARTLLPVLRANLAAAATRHSLPASLGVELLPIVEDGLFGYEVLPSRDAHTYLTVGRNDRGEPTLRRSLYCVETPGELRLATVNGRLLSQRELDASHLIRTRDEAFPDWPSAAHSLWTALAALFPEGPRHPVAFHDAPHADLDAALAAASAHLAGRDPVIAFCGVPDEAKYGFGLRHANGEGGHLVGWPPGRWKLRWEGSGGTLTAEWPGAAVDAGAGRAWARADAGGRGEMPAADATNGGGLVPALLATAAGVESRPGHRR
jgi:hypothetical protein